MAFDTKTMMPTTAVHSTTGWGDDGMPVMVKFESVKTPLPSDILCGKNKICIKHEGSQNFRRIIESYTIQYQQAWSRNAKMEVTKAIFDQLQTKRFLKYNEENEMWETLHPLAVRDKIGHALRFSNRKGPSPIRKQVRHITSGMSTFRQADLTSLRASSSMGAMKSLRSPIEHGQITKQNSTGNLPLPNFKLTQQSSGFHFVKHPQLNATWPQVHSFPTESSLNNCLSDPVKPSSGVDLSWMLQMPLMEMESDGKVYFVNGQH